MTEPFVHQDQACQWWVSWKLFQRQAVYEESSPHHTIHGAITIKLQCLSINSTVLILYHADCEIPPFIFTSQGRKT